MTNVVRVLRVNSDKEDGSYVQGYVVSFGVSVWTRSFTPTKNSEVGKGLEWVYRIESGGVERHSKDYG